MKESFQILEKKINDRIQERVEKMVRFQMENFRSEMQLKVNTFRVDFMSLEFNEITNSFFNYIDRTCDPLDEVHSSRQSDDSGLQCQSQIPEQVFHTTQTRAGTDRECTRTVA